MACRQVPFRLSYYLLKTLLLPIFTGIALLILRVLGADWLAQNSFNDYAEWGYSLLIFVIWIRVWPQVIRQCPNTLRIVRFINLLAMLFLTSTSIWSGLLLVPLTLLLGILLLLFPKGIYIYQYFFPPAIYWPQATQGSEWG